MASTQWPGVLFFALPGVALAAPPSTGVLDLRGGPVGELTAKSLTLAHGLLAFLLVLGLVLELLRGPGQRRHYLSVVWRTLLVLGLLQAYPFLAGTVVKQFTSLGDSLASPDMSSVPLDVYRSAVAHGLGSLPQTQGAAAQAPSGGPAAGVLPPDVGTGVGGFLFTALLGALLVFSLCVSWVFAQLSSILIGFFYAIGPLALVFYVPGLDAPARWLRSLVTISCWPVVSSVLLHLASSVLGQTGQTDGAAATFFGLAASFLLCALTFTTPKICTALVGGVGNLFTEGAAAAARVASRAATTAMLR
jgi:hypothetical protein